MSSYLTSPEAGHLMYRTSVHPKPLPKNYKMTMPHSLPKATNYVLGPTNIGEKEIAPPQYPYGLVLCSAGVGECPYGIIQDMFYFHMSDDTKGWYYKIHTGNWRNEIKGLDIELTHNFNLEPSQFRRLLPEAEVTALIESVESKLPPLLPSCSPPKVRTGN